MEAALAALTDAAPSQRGHLPVEGMYAVGWWVVLREKGGLVAAIFEDCNLRLLRVQSAVGA
jgi:hypothetical protein